MATLAIFAARGTARLMESIPKHGAQRIVCGPGALTVGQIVSKLKNAAHCPVGRRCIYVVVFFFGNVRHPCLTYSIIFCILLTSPIGKSH